MNPLLSTTTFFLASFSAIASLYLTYAYHKAYRVFAYYPTQGGKFSQKAMRGYRNRSFLLLAFSIALIIMAGGYDADPLGPIVPTSIVTLGAITCLAAIYGVYQVRDIKAFIKGR